MIFKIKNRLSKEKRCPSIGGQVPFLDSSELVLDCSGARDRTWDPPVNSGTLYR